MGRLCIALALIATFVPASLVAQTPAPPQASGGQAAGTGGQSTAAAGRPDEYVRTFFLTYGVAQELHQALAQLAASAPGPRPVITVNRSTNSLTIRGTQTALQSAEEVIRQLDIPGRSIVAADAPSSPQARAGQATTPAAQAPAAPTTPRAPTLLVQGVSPVSSATNIRLDIALTDNHTGTPVRKDITLLMLQGNGGMIRTGSSAASLNVDAVATAYQNGLISLKLTFEYQGVQPKEGPMAGVRVAGLIESITVVLQDGKPLLVSQSADPASDRRVTVEVTATILK